MAVKRMKGSTGSLTMPSGINADWAAWTDEVSQQVDDTSNYTDEETATSCEGSGCSTHNVTYAGFLKYNASGTAPGMAALPGDPGSATLLLATGCSWSGDFVIERMAVAARKIAGAIPVTGSMRSSGVVVEAWASGT